MVTLNPSQPYGHYVSTSSNDSLAPDTDMAIQCYFSYHLLLKNSTPYSWLLTGISHYVQWEVPPFSSLFCTDYIFFCIRG